MYLSGQDKEGQTRDIAHSEMIPTEPTRLSFWTKFLELQYKMFMAKGDVEMEHKYSSEPIQWPLLSKNVAYWMSPNSNVSGTEGIISYMDITKLLDDIWSVSYTDTYM